MAHEVSKSFEIDGKETLIPTVLEGKQLTDDEAVAAFRDGRIKSLGEFSSPEEATAFSKARSDERDQQFLRGELGPGPLGVITISPAPFSPLDIGPPGDDDIGPRYSATRQATEQSDAVEELEAEFGPELDAEEEAQEPEPEPVKPVTEEGIDVGAVLRDIGRGSIEVVGLQAVGGLRDAAQETLEAMDSLAVWLNTHIADLTVFDPETALRLDFPEVPQAETVTGGIGRGIVQFVAGMVGAGKFTGLSKLKNLSKVGEVGRLGLQGAIADGIARDPNEENLANLLRELTDEQENAALNFMASDPDDGEAVARLKKAFEGFGVGALVDAVILGLGTLRAAGKVRKAAADETDALAKSTEAAGKAAETTAGEAAGAALFADAPDAQAALLEMPDEQEGEIQLAGLGSAIVKGLRKARQGADEITRQRTRPGATPQSLVGDLDRPLVETIEGTSPQQFLDETGPALPEMAININLAKLDTPDDIKRAIDETANLFGAEIDEARRGVQTNEVTESLASDMGLTVEQLLSRRQGEAFNAETALAARRMLASSASQLIDLAKAASDNGGDRELLAFRRAMVIHGAIQQQVSGLTAEAGRALQSFKILAGSEREMTRNVQEMIDAAGGSRVSRKMAERLADAAESGALTRAQLNEVVRKGALARTSDAFLEVWINSLLSGPQTQAVNLLSNALVAAWQIPTRFVASKLPGGGADAVAAGETKALFYGMVRGYSEGLILAGRAIRTGESTDVLAKIDLPQRKAISAEAFNLSGVPGQAVDLLGETVRLPGRFLLAGDELFKSVGYRMELSARAFRQATSEGLEGDAMASRIDEIIRNPPEDIRLAAIDAGRYQTFTKPLGEGGQAFQGVVNAVPILRLVTPFIRTPINIMKFVGEGTVLAPLSRNVRAELAAGGSRRQIATAKIAMGSMASAFAADMAARGLMTGNGPSDPDTRRIWMQTHQPNSIRVGDEWVAYGRLEPLGAFFGIAADIQMIMGDLDDPERENLATALVVAIGKNVTSKTFLRGLSEAARVLDNPDRFGERYIQQFAGTAVPSVVAQVARVQDPVLRDVRTIYDKLCSRVPGCSTSLPPRRNIWGEAIVLGGGIGPDIMSPIYTNKVKLDPVSDEILRLGVRQQMPSRQIEGVELTPQEYDEYTRLAGQSAKEELTKLIKRKDYKTASDGPDGLKALAIKKVFQATRAKARARILKDRSFRELRTRVEERSVERRRKLRTPAGIQLPGSP